MHYNPSDCPPYPEEVAEAYCLGTLARGDVAAFEEHYLVCTACLAELSETERYVRAAQAAALRLRAQTNDRRGTVRLA